ncbi:24456_t:CDS:2, partial [Gigaspora margarita]
MLSTKETPEAIPIIDKSGWFRAGSNPSFYYMGVDSAVFYGNASGTSGFINFNPVYETNLTPDTFGTMMQAFIPQGFLNKRVQLTCFVKYTNVTDYAGMWMRVDTNTTQTLDNMSNRPLKGTGDWTKCVSVLDVHQDAVNLAFDAWFNQFEFTIVDNNTQTTSLYV